MDLTDKVVIVTGAARRVGRAIALDLARHGCHIVVHYRQSSAEADDLARAIRDMHRRCSLISGDLADNSVPARIVAHAIAEHGRLDGVVNNAAVFPATPVDTLTPEQFVHTLQINLVAPVMLAAAAWPHFKRAGTGKVVNIVDIYAERPRAGHIAYCAAKAGLANATRSLARAMAPIVQVNAVAPGVALFPEDLDPAAQERILAKVPLARPGSPADIAAAVRFLLGEADYMTGQIITVDGGRSITW
jgi:pteridine reductase